jgi:hypothetical protein
LLNYGPDAVWMNTPWLALGVCAARPAKTSSFNITREFPGWHWLFLGSSLGFGIPMWVITSVAAADIRLRK